MRTIEVPGTDAQTTDTGAELLEQMRAGVMTVDMIQSASSLAGRYRKDESLARDLNAFIVLALSGGPEGNVSTADWRLGSGQVDVVDPDSVAKAMEQLGNDGRDLTRSITEGDWVTDFVSDWEHRIITLWKPTNVADPRNLLRSARYKMQTDQPEEGRVGIGEVISGEIYAIDIEGNGTIGLYNGKYRRYDAAFGKPGSTPLLYPTPIEEREFRSATVQDVFNRSRNPSGGSDLWLSTIAIREITDYGTGIHPEKEQPAS